MDSAKLILTEPVAAPTKLEHLSQAGLDHASDEKKKQIQEMQKELLKPVKVKFAELIEHLGDTLKKAIDEAAQSPKGSNTQLS